MNYLSNVILKLQSFECEFKFQMHKAANLYYLVVTRYCCHLTLFLSASENEGLIFKYYVNLHDPCLNTLTKRFVLRIFYIVLTLKLVYNL